MNSYEIHIEIEGNKGNFYVKSYDIWIYDDGIRSGEVRAWFYDEGYIEKDIINHNKTSRFIQESAIMGNDDFWRNQMFIFDLKDKTLYVKSKSSRKIIGYWDTKYYMEKDELLTENNLTRY